MNESILLRFFHEDTPVEITDVHPDRGIVLAGETSAFPIPGGLAIFPAGDPISQNAFQQIQKIEDWRDGRFRVNVDRQGDRLVLTGAGKRQPEKNLPPIGYKLDVKLKNTQLSKSQFEFRLPKDGKKEVEIRIKEPKRLKLVDIKDWDAQTKAIVTSGDSKLDGLGCLDWLKRPVVRGARKVCLLNLLAHLRALPSVKDTLSSDVASVMLADIDRAVVRVGSGFLKRMRELTKGSDPAFGEDSGPIHPTHARVRDRVIGAGGSAYKLHSFRQRTSQISMQVIVGEPPSGDPDAVHYAELDIDLGNPFVDVVGFGTHLFELLDPSATNHFELAPKMPADFRYYSFAKKTEA